MDAALNYDLFVIGGGSGGVRAARMAASHGVKVGLAEGSRLGGTCVNLGCIPKKLLANSADYGEKAMEATDYGWRLMVKSFDWSGLIANKDQEIARLNQIYENLLRQAGVTIHPSWVKITGRQDNGDFILTTTAKETIIAKKILIASGSTATKPAFAGGEYAKVSDDMFHLPQLPKRVLVLGGGYIAVEFASILNGLGVETSLAYRGSQILRGFDDDVRNFMAKQMQAKGVHLMLHCEPEILTKSDDGTMMMKLRHPQGNLVWQGDLVLTALGRKPNLAGLGLETIGLSAEPQGGLAVDDDYQTKVGNVFALGDVINRVTLTPVAIHEAMVFVARQFGPSEKRRSTKPLSYDNIPTAVFGEPNIGTVGLGEAAAKAIYGAALDIYQSEFRPLRQTLIKDSKTRVYMKLIVRQADNRVIGCHMVGPDAGEIIQGFAVAMTAGATKDDFDQTIGIHPTLAEEFVTMRQKRP